MTKKGREFEGLVFEIYQVISNTHPNNSVEMDIHLESPDGLRQIDVLIRSEIAGMPILTIIECKDHKRNLDVTFVDALVSKMADVNANKGVLVARKGFSNGALKKARRLGITMCVADDASHKLRKIGFDLPVIGHHVEPTDKISFEFEFAEGQSHDSIRVNANSLFNGMGLL